MKLNFTGSKYSWSCTGLTIGSVRLQDGYCELNSEESAELSAHPAFEELKAIGAIEVIDEPKPTKATK